MLNKFKAGAQKAAVQATAFAKEGSSRMQTGSQSFVQGFTLPGEAEKAAKILDSFLGMYCVKCVYRYLCTNYGAIADPENPQSALNAIPKAVLQRARGAY